MNKILCSTGALIGRPNNRDYHLIKPLSDKLHCDGYEFMMYSTWYDEVEALVEYLQSTGLEFPAMHCEKSIGEEITVGNFKEALRRFEINCGIAGKIGAGKLVLHLWDGQISDSNFQNNLNAFGELQKMAETQGIDLLAENVVCNRENPMKHWCELRERYPDVHFVFDTKMAAFHSQMELIYEEEYRWLWREGHIRHLHVNDYAGGHMEWSKLKTLPIGAGYVNFERFFEFVRKIGYEGTYTVEATAFDQSGDVNTDMLNVCFDKIRNRFT